MTSTADGEVVRAGRDDAEAVSSLIAEAFCSLDATAWLVPEPDQRQRVLAANFRIFVEHALDHGEVQLTADRSAVAVWFPMDAGPLPPPADYERRLAEAVGPWTERFQVLDGLFEANHPAEPHHHLAFLAVRPDRQGRGLGSALLRHHHARLDGAGTAAYLEASSERSRDLYLRHGYEPHGEPFRLPDGTPFWPMWRTARPAS
jgi:ribosomal protein S18 acetylase RimI-like enzyme